jgi:hypothetical protein
MWHPTIITKSQKSNKRMMAKTITRRQKGRLKKRQKMNNLHEPKKGES